MIDQQTEEVLQEVLDWFNSGNIGYMPEQVNQMKELEGTIRKLCGGDPASVDKLTDGYLTKAVDYLDNQRQGVRAVLPDGLLHDWSGSSADQFRDFYVGPMSTAMDDCQAIAEGICAIMAAFQQTAQKTHESVLALLDTVKQKQQSLPFLWFGFTLSTMGAVLDALTGFTPLAAAMTTAELLGDMNAAVKLVNYSVTNSATISGLIGNAILASSVDAVRQLDSAVGTEIAKLNKMVDTVNTKLASDELKVPPPKIVTDQNFDQTNFDDGDPNKTDDTSALV